MCRCDGKIDCKDNSDEEACRVVEVGSSYNKYLSPGAGRGPPRCPCSAPCASTSSPPSTP